MTTYRVLLLDETSEDGKTAAFILIGEREAHGPDAACLAAAEDRAELMGDVASTLVAVPLRNWHETPIEPTRGFAIGAPKGQRGIDDSGLPNPPGNPVTVVVSGAPQEVDAEGDVIALALESAGIVANPEVDTTWTLRDEDGQKVDVDTDGRIFDGHGATLFLDPDAGP